MSSPLYIYAQASCTPGTVFTQTQKKGNLTALVTGACQPWAMESASQDLGSSCGPRQRMKTTGKMGRQHQDAQTNKIPSQQPVVFRTAQVYHCKSSHHEMCFLKQHLTLLWKKFSPYSSLIFIRHRATLTAKF